MEILKIYIEELLITADLPQWFINFLIKKLVAEQLKIILCLTKNQQKNYTNQLLENLIKHSSVYSSFIDNIWGADLAGMQLIK